MSPLNALHHGAKFEGYCTKFALEAGAILIIIMCTIPDSPDPNRRHNVTVTYCRPGKVTWQRELWPRHAICSNGISTASSIGQMSPSQQQEMWQLSFWDDAGALIAAMGTDFQELTAHLGDSAAWNLVKSDDTDIDVLSTKFFVRHMDPSVEPLHLAARTTSRTPWSVNNPSSSPEGFLGLLPLPLHWHVHSLDSQSQVALVALPASGAPVSDEHHFRASAHEEKNWANGFPSAHMWVQARDTAAKRYVCLAGGRTMGVDAYLVGYRNAAQGLALDFRPPLAMRALGLTPFLSISRDWHRRQFELTVSNFSQRLVINASAPADSFFTLAAPTPQGFKDHAMAQTSNAQITIDVYERRWWALDFSWKHRHSDTFSELGSLEFGGDYYPVKGKKQPEVSHC